MNLQRNPGCTACRLHEEAEYVCLLGKGPIPCEAMIVGEAPGRREDDSGVAFVGKSGQLLEETLEKFSIKRRKIYITNAVHCRPPGNRTPTKGEIKKCKPWLEAEIAAVKPKFILILGNTPLLSLTGKPGIRARRGRPFDQDGVIYLPTYHPAYILRTPELMDVFERDIHLFSEILQRGEIPREEQLDYKIVSTEEDMEELIDALEGTVSYDLETTCLYPWARETPKIEKSVDAKINLMGWGTRDRQYILPVEHPESSWLSKSAALGKYLDRIDQKMQECYVVMQNGKFDALWTWVHYGYQWFPDFDTMLAHYLLDENSRHGLKELAMRYCGAPDWDVGKDTKTRGPLSEMALYHAHDLYYTRKLRFILGKKMEEEDGIKRLFEELAMPCSRLFTEIEYDGVCIDVTKMDEAEKVLKKMLAEAEKELEEYNDGSVDNWGSPKQLGKLLFERLKLPVIERTEAGNASTSESVINRIDHPIGSALLKFRGARQQLSFFIEGWKPYLVKVGRNWFLHPSFKLHGTKTGRPSCENPNLQQVPRDERIRQLVKAPEDWVLVEFDLSQIELRIIAEISGEPTLREVFITGQDAHWLTAIREIERGGGLKDIVLETARTAKQDKSLTYSESIEALYEIGPDVAADIDPAWKEHRKKAKAVNFGYVYGMWWKKFKKYAKDNYGIDVTDRQAQDSRKYFFQTYQLESWHKRQKRYARINGYTHTLTQRKRRLPEAQSPDDTPARREAERQAINSPVQGFAAELNLMCALQLRKEYDRDKVRICGTIHDAILFWCRPQWIREVAERLLKICERPDLFDTFEIEFSVPITGEIKIGPWSKGVKLEKWLKENVGNRRA